MIGWLCLLVVGLCVFFCYGSSCLWLLVSFFRVVLNGEFLLLIDWYRC